MLKFHFLSKNQIFNFDKKNLIEKKIFIDFHEKKIKIIFGQKIDFWNSVRCKKGGNYTGNAKAFNMIHEVLNEGCKHSC